MPDSNWAVVLHGGCKPMKRSEAEQNREGLQDALAEAVAILSAGGSALEAVEAAVRVLEDNPAFNAGNGSKANAEGEAEMDAAIMDGETLDVGAICALKDTPNPISVARSLLRETETLLAGEGAFRFAQSKGLAKPGSGKHLVAEGVGTSTVGCIALDGQGHLAAATSTGGTGDSKPGRVGDSPIPGLGTYADDAVGALSATGEGESIARVMLGARAMLLMEAGHAPQAAVEQALAHLTRVGGDAGLIALSRDGRIGWKHTGTQFALGWATSNDPAFRIEIANLEEAEDG